MKTREMKPDIMLRAIPFMATLVIGLFLSLFSVEGSGMFQITEDAYNQWNPAIYGDIVVWEDDRNGNYDIYGCNLSTQDQFPICTNPHDQLNPAIYGDIVIWVDSRGKYKSIYGYSLSAQEEFPIATSPSLKSDPAIYGDIVVWTDKRNRNEDIYGYNLETKKEFQITTDPEDQHYPAIYNDTVIWVDERYLMGAIYRYDLSEQQEYQITTGWLSCWPYPVIHGDFIVWGETKIDTRIIDSYNLSESRKSRIFRDYVWPCKPETMDGTRLAIYGDIVLWVDYSTCNRDIRAYNLREHQELSIVIDRNGHHSPAIYKDIVIWVSERDGKTDIWGVDLRSHIIPKFFTYRVKVILICFFCGMLAAFPALMSVCMGVYVKRIISEEMAAPEELKDFRRSATLPIVYAFLAAIPFLHGVHSIIYDTGDGVSLLFYFLQIIFASSFIYYAVWSKRTPYVRMTNDKIIVLEGRLSKEVIRWSDIQEINFKGKKVELIGSSGKKVKIDLSSVNKKDKEGLIEILRHSPYKVSFSP